MKKTNLTVVILFAVLLSTACSGAFDGLRENKSAFSGAAAPAYEEAYAPAEYEAAEEASFDEFDSANGAQMGEVSEPASSRKLIKSMQLQAETREFDRFLAGVETKVASLGGYVETSNIWNGSSFSENAKTMRHASYVFRIPAEKLDEFVEAIETKGNVTGKDTSVRDVTLSYVDLESHRNALREEEEQLLALMDEAVTIEEIIEIRNALTDVRYQLESMESQLRTYDNQIEYSTVTLDVSEVEVLTPVEEKTAGERISEGFSENLAQTMEDVQNFCIWFVSHIPYMLWVLVRALLLILVIWLIVRLIIRLVSGDKKQRMAKKAERKRLAEERRQERERQRAEQQQAARERQQERERLKAEKKQGKAGAENPAQPAAAPMEHPAKPAAAAMDPTAQANAPGAIDGTPIEAAGAGPAQPANAGEINFLWPAAGGAAQQEAQGMHDTGAVSENGGSSPASPALWNADAEDRPGE